MSSPLAGDSPPHILITEPINDSALNWLRDHGAVTVLMYAGADWEAQAPLIRGIIVRAFRVTTDVLDQLPALEVVAKHGVGVNTIDLEETTRRGIVVTNVPGANANSVAEHAVALLSALSRDLIDADALLRSGRFSERFDLRLMKELSESRLGIVGAGRIGRRIAAICRGGYGCEIGFYDPFVDPSSMADSRLFDAVEALFDWADNVVVAAPLTQQTRGLVTREVLDHLGPEGSIVCASRGGIIDEIALADAVRESSIRGAALDVYDPEPPSRDHPLLTLPGTAFTPHVAFSSDKSMERMGMDSVRQLWALLHGKPAPIVTAESWG